MELQDMTFGGFVGMLNVVLRSPSDPYAGRKQRRSRFPEGMTEGKARANTEADPCGMTARKAKKALVPELFLAEVFD
jgi:hypothetical protein